MAPTQNSPNRERLQAAPSLESRVVAPTPGIAQRDITMQVPGSHAIQVQPPIMSAPEQFSNQKGAVNAAGGSCSSSGPASQSRDGEWPGYGPGQLQRQKWYRLRCRCQGATGGARAPGAGRWRGCGASPGSDVRRETLRERDSEVGWAEPTTVVPPPIKIWRGWFVRSSIRLAGWEVARRWFPAPSVAGGVAGGLGSGNRANGRGVVGDLGDVAFRPTSGRASGNGKGVVVSEAARIGNRYSRRRSGGAGDVSFRRLEARLWGIRRWGRLGAWQWSGKRLHGKVRELEGQERAKGSELNAQGWDFALSGTWRRGDRVQRIARCSGVSVRGGNNIVKLPSFSDGSSAPSVCLAAWRKAKKENEGPGITIVASARSGGAFNFYGALKGDKVYTIYIDTTLGPAVLQFADPSSAAHPYATDLGSPRPIRAELPAGLARTRLVIACVLDRTGELKGVQVLEPGDAGMTSKVLAALPRWKFQPATRDGKAVEVNAILGFNIDTNDRF